MSVKVKLDSAPAMICSSIYGFPIPLHLTGPSSPIAILHVKTSYFLFVLRAAPPIFHWLTLLPVWMLVLSKRDLADNFITTSTFDPVGACFPPFFADLDSFFDLRHGCLHLVCLRCCGWTLLAKLLDFFRAPVRPTFRRFHVYLRNLKPFWKTAQNV